MNLVTILYHKNCPDGHTAAWVLRKKFPEAEYIAVSHGEAFPPNLEGREVIIVDFCYEPKALEELQSIVASLQVLDHHITAMHKCGHLPYCKFDLTKSGAGLAWDYISSGTKPLLIQLIEFRDLGHLWNNPDLKPHPKTLELLAAIDSFEKTFDIWDYLDSLLSTNEGIENLSLQGEAILRFCDEQFKRILENKHEVVLYMEGGPVRCAAINSPIFQSEIGNRLSQATGLPAIVYHQGKESIKCSLRSKSNDRDVSTLAKQFKGGGGHRQAAGFALEGQFLTSDQKFTIK